MQNEGQLENNMETSENNKTQERPPAAMAASYQFYQIDCVTKPYMHFHKTMVKDHMRPKSITNRIKTINNAKTQLLEELNNIHSMQTQIVALINRYQEYKKWWVNFTLAKFRLSCFFS